MIDGSRLVAESLNVLAQLFGQPFLYIGIVIVFLQFRRQVKLERKLFHARLHAPAAQTWQSIGCGCLAGLFASLFLAAAGFSMPWQATALLWAISVLLLMVRVRFLNMVYAAGIIGIWTAAVDTFPSLRETEMLSPLVDPFIDFRFASLLLLVGLLQVIAGVMMRLRGAMHAVPVFLDGKRGKTIGAYHLHQWWPVPVLLFVPAKSASFVHAISEGSFFWQGDWSVAAFPLLFGFCNVAVSVLPKQKVRKNANFLLVFGIVLMLLAVAADLIPPLVAYVSAAAILILEIANGLSFRKELQGSPVFVHDKQGLRVLAVLPGSPAAEMGVVAGEIIRKVNGKEVLTKEELHVALQINPAFCKLEIINLDGHSKFAGKAIFAGDHHQLGILLAPDDDAAFTTKTHNVGAFRYLSAGLKQTRREV